jgi:hypothetical protein
VFGVDHHAAAYAAVGVQRRTEVDLAFALAARAQADAGGAGEDLAVGVLADQVDRRRRVAGAVQQTAGAAHDFNMVVDGQVGLGLTGVAAGHRCAVDLQLLDLEAARVKVAAHAVNFPGRDAVGVVGDVEHGLQRLVVNPFTGDDADRLRSIADRQIQAGGGIGGAYRVGVFGGTGYCDGRQGDGIGIGVARLRGPAEQREQCE